MYVCVFGVGISFQRKISKKISTSLPDVKKQHRFLFFRLFSIDWTDYHKKKALLREEKWINSI